MGAVACWQYERMGYRYRVLGTTQALREDGTPVPLGGARLRVLLGVLALAGGRTVRTETLVGEVWSSDAQPPADQVGALQALVGRLRRTLGRDAIASGSGGYRLVVEERTDVDLFRFERLVDDGLRELAADRTSRAAELLDEALALWEGPACADLPDGGGAAAVRAEARHLDARRGRLEADLALGHAETALPALRAWAAERPLDEPLQALLLRALRDTGRQAEALDAYEAVRSALADRLGAAPSRELRALHADLLSASADSIRPEGPSDGEAGTGTGTSAAPAARDGAAVRPLPGPAGSEAAESGGPVEAGSAPRGNLRARLTSFVGRESEVEAIRADLARARLVTLTGPGGSGKTRLSQETAATLTGNWPDGVWVAELAPVRDPAQLAEAVLTSLGGRETVIRGSTAEGLQAAADPRALDPLAQLAERCAARRMLLVLDNCEHLIDAAASLTETLLVDCPHITVLATSREPLGVEGEVVRPVEPLPEPVALRLLADRGAAAGPGFRVEQDPRACAEICQRLDGLPLAIELAAARLRALTPRQLADRLDDRFRLLTSGRRTVLPRQQTLRAVVDWSWELLEESERAVLRRLSVFSGGCALEQAEAVCGDPPPGEQHPSGDAPEAGEGTRATAALAVPARDVAGVLGSLVDKSLVVALNEPAPAAGPQPEPESAHAGFDKRYTLLETVAEYAAERLDEVPGERAAVERRHLVAYRELARTTDPLLRGPDQYVHFERLEREHDNIRAALRRAVDGRDEHEALCLVLSMAWFWQLRDHRSDVVAWTHAVTALCPDPFAGPTVVPAPPLTERCTDAPPPMPPEQLEEARRGVWLMKLTDFELSGAAEEGSEHQERLQRVVQTYRPGLPQTCRLPGSMWVFGCLMTGDVAWFVEVLDATVEACRSYEYEWELAFVLQLRAKLLGEHPGGSEQAMRDSDESLEIFRRVGDSWGMAEALAGRAEARCLRGEYAAGAEDYRQAIAWATRLVAHSQVPMLKARLGGALVEIDDPDDRARGEALLREAIDETERMGGEGPNFAVFQYAFHLGRQQKASEARALLEPMEARVAESEPEIFSGMLQSILAWLLCLDGEYERALTKARGALGKGRSTMAQVVAPTFAVLQWLTAAWALAGSGRPVAAARLIGAYDVHRDPRSGDSGFPGERDLRGQAEAAARAALGAAPPDRPDAPAQMYSRAYAEGAGLSPVEATALVQRTDDHDEAAAS